MTAVLLFQLDRASVTLLPNERTGWRAALAAFSPSERLRLKLVCIGRAQGVGFRPFVYRLATAQALAGKTYNTREGVCIELEGNVDNLMKFLADFFQHSLVLSNIYSLSILRIQLEYSSDFQIVESLDEEQSDAGLPSIPLDAAPCETCIKELFSPFNRRHLYPFISCSTCGPRFSILCALPYDRKNTTLHDFLLCDDCLQEYHNPLDRRFHAQPIACHRCGPQLEWYDASGTLLASRADALERALEAICLGKCVALMGVGGFQLLVSAQNEAAVERLRQTKRRPHKPFAVMVRDLQQAHSLCHISEAEATLLTSPGRPIVLLRRRGFQWQIRGERKDVHEFTESHCNTFASNIAPFLDHLGILLPASPLHMLLMHRLDCPVVCTSGNRSGEPLCTTLSEGMERLDTIADGYLCHNRPIARPLDDSVARIIEGKPQFLRVSRGAAPLVFQAPAGPDGLGLGGHLKTTVALRRGAQVMIGPHIGDLESVLSVAQHTRSARDLVALCHAHPAIIVKDLHPDHASANTALALMMPQTAAPDGPPWAPPHVFSVQHHEAHARACLLEHPDALADGHALAVVWDGSGDGGDGTLFGGEFFRLDAQHCQRVVSLFPLRLPGGSRAFAEPARCALGLLYALMHSGPDSSAPYPDPRLHAWHQEALKRLPFSSLECTLLQQLLQKGIQSPQTSSVGRMFDGIAALLNIPGSRETQTYEGQVAIQLEQSASQALMGADEGAAKVDGGRQFPKPTLLPSTLPGLPQLLDWRPFVAYCLETHEESMFQRALDFHRWLMDAIVLVAQSQKLTSVILTGGCFQNRLLLEGAILLLRRAGCVPYWSQQLPPNDGGIAPGQVMSPEFR